LPKPCSQTNGPQVECPSAACRRRCAASLASVRGNSAAIYLKAVRRQDVLDMCAARPRPESSLSG
jgi:hypothetical protein